MFNFSWKKEIVPEVLWSLRNRFPDKLQVKITSSEDGGYSAVVINLPGCVTEGDTFSELYQMINTAVYDYLKVPREYIPYLSSYSPPKEVIEEMQRRGEHIPEKVTEVIFQRA